MLMCWIADSKSTVRSVCSAKFESGDRVTYTGKDYLCNVCLETASSVTATPLLGVEEPQMSAMRAPVATSTPGRAGDMVNGSALNGTNGKLDKLPSTHTTPHISCYMYFEL